MKERKKSNYTSLGREEIFDILSSSDNNKKMAEKYHLTVAAIQRIRRGETFKHHYKAFSLKARVVYIKQDTDEPAPQFDVPKGIKDKVYYYYKIGEHLTASFGNYKIIINLRTKRTEALQFNTYIDGESITDTRFQELIKQYNIL